MEQTVTLSSGSKMPLMGLGTLAAKSDELKQAIESAIDIGYRHIDTAWAYFNEKEIGEALQKVFQAGKVKRSEMFITTKLHVQYLHKEDVMPKLKEQLQALQLDYVDLYLVHGCGGVKKVDGNPFPIENGKVVADVVDHMETWGAMENCYKAGLTKNIGICNYGVEQVQNLWDKASVKPHNLQSQLHIYWPQNELHDLCKRLNIGMTSYGTIGSPGEKNPIFQIKHPVLMDDPTVVQLAEKYKKSPSQILIRWVTQRGICVIPKSVNPKRQKENYDSLNFTLSPEDFKTLSDIKERHAMYNLSLWDTHPQFPKDSF